MGRKNSRATEVIGRGQDQLDAVPDNHWDGLGRTSLHGRRPEAVLPAAPPEALAPGPNLANFSLIRQLVLWPDQMITRAFEDVERRLAHRLPSTIQALPLDCLRVPLLKYRHVKLKTERRGLADPQEIDNWFLSHMPRATTPQTARIVGARVIGTKQFDGSVTKGVGVVVNCPTVSTEIHALRKPKLTPGLRNYSPEPPLVMLAYGDHSGDPNPESWERCNELAGYANELLPPGTLLTLHAAEWLLGGEHPERYPVGQVPDLGPIR